MKFLHWLTAPALALVIWLEVGGHWTGAGWAVGAIWAVWILSGAATLVLALARVAKGAAQRAALNKTKGGLIDDE